MSEWDPSPDRPVIYVPVSSAVRIPAQQSRGGERVFRRNEGTRAERIQAGFRAAEDALNEQVELTDSLHATDPHLVLVLEAVESANVDLAQVARKLHLEVLIEADGDRAPDDEYQLKSERVRDHVVKTSLHAVCADPVAMKALLNAWSRRSFLSSEYGSGQLAKLFECLDDVRPWGPADRLQWDRTDQRLAGLLDDQNQRVDVELWYRNSASARASASTKVRSLVTSSGGRVLREAVLEEIGYHGLRCELPVPVLRTLVTGEFADVALIRSADVMYLRVSGQVATGAAEVADPPIEASGPTPHGAPVLCVLDGVPAQNHRLLRDRVQVLDPDDYEGRAAVAQRAHGTAMSSVAVWGDLARSDVSPARRPVLVRPVMVPSEETVSGGEELPSDVLVPDLMWRVFRELFEGSDGNPPAAPEVAIISISIGDPAFSFDTVLSSWARALDWLSEAYGVLVIVSAGNRTSVQLSSMSSREFYELPPVERKNALWSEQERSGISRRLIAPAESINAITVGAWHSDHAKEPNLPYAFDPLRGLSTISPVTPLGSGYARSIKPEVVAPGGRITYQTPRDPLPGLADSVELVARIPGPAGPGIAVAHPADRGSTTHVVGTSPAAAEVARIGALLHDEVVRVADGHALRRSQRAVAIKALLVHGVSPINMGRERSAVRLAVGDGPLTRDLSEGCGINEAVVLYLGTLRPQEQHTLEFPLPDGLATRDLKEIGATLAWFSPVSWRQKRYRLAKLELCKPTGVHGMRLTSRPIDEAKRGATTVQHLSWETSSVIAAGSRMKVPVKCHAPESFGVHPIEYAVVVSLRAAPLLGVDIYNQVREAIMQRSRTAIRQEG